MGRTLALTDTQMRLVESAARQVPANHRQDFLIGVEEALLRNKDGRAVSDEDVLQACQRFLFWSVP